MDISSFYTDHWREIEDERIARYEEMFVWQEGHKALLAPAALEPGLNVMDLGAGPGFFAGGLAELVGPRGSVAGVDINARFVADANARHADNPAVTFHHVEDHRLPFAEDTFDRVICKNVLEYVPDLDGTLTEIRRVLKPGGKVIFAEHGEAPDAGVVKWQNRLNPMWNVIGGGCNLNRRIEHLYENTGFAFKHIDRGYLPGPKWATYNYRGIASVS